MSAMIHDDCSIPTTVDIWETVCERIGPVSSVALEITAGHQGLNAADKSPELRPGSKLTVGRTSDADWCVAGDEKMSRVHFELECRDQTVVLRDLESTNGTRVNGTKFRELTLYHGDQIVAGATTFSVRINTDC